MKSFILIRAVSTSDMNKALGMLISEGKAISYGGYAGSAYKVYNSGVVVYTEGLYYPYYLLDPNIQMFLYNTRLPGPYKRVSFLVSGANSVLDVSVFIPHNLSQIEKAALFRVLSSITFLPPEQRLAWNYGQIIDPEAGIQAALIPIPAGFSVQGGVLDQGTKRMFTYNIARGGEFIRVDFVDVVTNMLQSNFGSNFFSVLTINGQRYSLDTPVYLRNFKEVVDFLIYLWGYETGESWQMLEYREIEDNPFFKELGASAGRPSIPLPPHAQNFSIKGYVIAKSSSGKERMAFISGAGVYSYRPDYLVASADCFVNISAEVVQAEPGRLLAMLNLRKGINAALVINPDWSLFALEKFTRENKYLNAFVREMHRKSQEFNSWMSRAWTNLLSDQTYVRDPSTGEVFKVYKRSWETGEFWKDPTTGEILFADREGALSDLLGREGWKKLEESVGGF
ncbi:MAG: hypothetical protein NZ900_08080 [Synergistetes bacterium]|nr:hypothetical protein [Synergistota bacterium]MDW8192876.1 hypothetical protein [Synergistota bacterium]